MLSHIVFFALHDNSEAKQQELVDACHRYLKKHPGIVYFAAGKLAPEFTRDVNMRDFDVTVQLFFEDNAAHDNYQTSEDHDIFIKAQKDNWKQVRVYDAHVS